MSALSSSDLKIKKQAGSLVECMIASAILPIAATDHGCVRRHIQGEPLAGDASTRTVEYAQDKMEALLGLSFGDGTSDMTQTPTCTVYSSPSCTLAAPSNTGLGGAMAANATVGGTNWQAPVAGYVDYIDANGQQLTSSTGAAYTRAWSIKADATGNLKTITVVAGPVQKPPSILRPQLCFA